MATLRKSAFTTLTIAVVLPFVLYAWIRLSIYFEYTRHGLYLEGKGPVAGYVLIIGVTAALWVASAGLYVASIIKEPRGSLSRIAEVLLFVPLPLGLWWAFRLIFFA